MSRRKLMAGGLDANAVMATLRTESGQPEWRAYKCTLVTPMYGGGVRAGEVDEAMPIRGASIRGQLRFWWRIACGSVGSSTEMFQREAALWGGIASSGPIASKVAVRVKEVSRPKIEPAYAYVRDARDATKFKRQPEAATWGEGYALFSAQGKLSDDRKLVQIAPREPAREGITFQLEIQLGKELTDRQRAEVKTTLRWWTSFGGVGARTRRGLGALKVEGVECITEDEVLAAGGWLALRASTDSATNAWKTAVGRLKDFRQKLDVGRNSPSQGSRSPAGRSLWPEADTLRELSGHAHTTHKERIVAGNVFPRAAFGLPLVFHFKDAPSKNDLRTTPFRRSEFDPDDHVLEPANISPTLKRDRMASPLILRPYWNGQKWQPAALLLPGWRKALNQPLKFKNQNYQPAHWPEGAVARREIAQQISPMKTATGALRSDDSNAGPDPLSAFMHYFEQRQ